MLTRALALDEQTQITVLQQLEDHLSNQFDAACATVCASLLSSQSSSALAKRLVKTLLGHATGADLDGVITVVHKTSWLSESLLEEINVSLDSFASSLQEEDPASKTEAQIEARQSAVKLLQLAKQLISSDISSTLLTRLYSQSLLIVQQSDQQIAYLAKDIVFSALAVIPPSPQSFAEVRECISCLLKSQDHPFQHTLGYALWLKSLVFHPASITISYLETPEYWKNVEDGLRSGNGERQKLCIEILRLSIPIAIEQNRVDLVSPIDNVSPAVVKSQYARFFTVFETVSLSRYGNLVAETDKTLQLLLSPQSVIDLRWPYVVLEVALRPTTDEKVRRHVGRWILSGSMSSNYKTPQFQNFFRETFFSWLLEGHLYTGTISLSNDSVYRCRHGSQVSTCVKHLFEAQISASTYSALLDLILSKFLRNRTGIFFYAVVYILQGIVSAFPNTAHIRQLTTLQVDQVLAVSDWQNMPEASKTFIMYCCWRLASDSEAATRQSEQSQLNDTSQLRLDSLRSLFESGVARKTAAPSNSKRDKRIHEALARCSAVQASACPQNVQTTVDSLTDIWTEVEYLEYPRDLMGALPRTYFNETIVGLIADGHDDTGTLSQLVTSTLDRLLQMTSTKSYLLAPLVSAIRRTVLLKPSASELLNIRDLIVTIARSPPEPKVDMKFEYATLDLLHACYRTDEFAIERKEPQSEESFGFATYLDLVNRLGGSNESTLLSVLQAILARWLQQKPPIPAVSPFKTSLQLQVVILCCEQVSPSTSPEAVDDLLQKLFKLLSIEQLPRYRYLLCWSILGLVRRFPAHRQILLTMLTGQDHHSNPKLFASLMKLSVELLSTEDATRDFADQLAVTFVALSASSKIVIRHEAQWSFPILMDIAADRGWHSITSNAAHVALQRYICSLPRYNDPPNERKLSRFDYATQNTMATLAEGSWTDLDYNRPPYTRRADFITLYERDTIEGLVDIAAPSLKLGDVIETQPPKEQIDDTPAESDLLISEPMTQDVAVALQTKGSAYLRMLLGGGKDESHQAHNLIVIASLIDNPHNLGGLSRVSEIFGAQALYVRDPRIIAEKDFKSVSVTSHNHIDIMPLSVEGMPEFLADKRKHGWTVIGVEQTDRSVILGQGAALPDKSILIIGNEKLGMPGHVISECDLLVEIPQVGVTRSMNVQTVAAVVLYEYNRQHTRES